MSSAFDDHRGGSFLAFLAACRLPPFLREVVLYAIMNASRPIEECACALCADVVVLPNRLRARQCACAAGPMEERTRARTRMALCVPAFGRGGPLLDSGVS